jgi:hypothetical protein
MANTICMPQPATVRGRRQPPELHRGLQTEHVLCRYRSERQAWLGRSQPLCPKLMRTRLFEPEVYAALGRSKTLITGTRDRREADKEKIKNLLACATKENEGAAQYIASQLFPVIAWAFGSAWHGPDWEERWASERRICSPRYFDRYFALRLPDGRISDSEFLGFIEICADRAVIDVAFADIRERGLLPEMLERLDQAAIAGKLPMDHIDALLPALFDIAEPLPNQMGFGAQMPFISCWRSASWYLKMERNQETRGSDLSACVERCEGLGGAWNADWSRCGQEV